MRIAAEKCQPGFALPFIKTLSFALAVFVAANEAAKDTNPKYRRLGRYLLSETIKWNFRFGAAATELLCRAESVARKCQELGLKPKAGS